MRATIPIDVTESMIVSHSIAEPYATEAGYSSSVTYSIGAMVTEGHDVYSSLQDNNLGNTPSASPLKWKLLYKSNRYRMFDFNNGEPSVSASPMNVVLRPRQRVDSIIPDGLVADRIEVIVKNGETNEQIFELDVGLMRRNVTSWWEYLFSPFEQTRIFPMYQIPPVSDPVIYLTLYSDSGDVEINKFGFGLSFDLGVVLNKNPIVDFENYSEITRDDFGRATLTPRPSIPTAKLNLATRANRLNAVLGFKKKSDGKVVAWSGLDDADNPYTQSLAFYGMHQEFNADLSDQGFAQIDLFLEGV